MNKQPDETTLTLWIDGELEGEELSRVEAWAQEHPELLAERDAIRAMNVDIRENIPASVEPPYADFFNQRIIRHIEDEQMTAAPASSQASKRRFWQWFAVPAAAAAMLLCFYMGTRVSDPVPTGSPSTLSVSTVPTVYTPDGDVSADMFSSASADATVIVLKGLEDIPDNLEMVGEPQRDDSGAVMVSTGSFY
ncbi:MAG: anti-sigma factor [Akkermansiaceae bacterium]